MKESRKMVYEEIHKELELREVELDKTKTRMQELLEWLGTFGLWNNQSEDN